MVEKTRVSSSDGKAMEARSQTPNWSAVSSSYFVVDVPSVSENAGCHPYCWQKPLVHLPYESGGSLGHLLAT